MAHSPATYLDGISVKISERYKPPKRITLALSYSQILTLNKLIQEPTPSYDFSLEDSIKRRVHEWREARATLADDRNQRLHSASAESESAEVLSSAEDTGSPPHSNEAREVGPFYSSESGVLIPITVGSAAPAAQYQTDTGFNFSEFESDTSSPFDNMELKTLNDLEQLAEVLKTDAPTDAPYPAGQLPLVDVYARKRATGKDSHLNGYYYSHPLFASRLGYGQETEANTGPGVEGAMRSVPEIMRSLEAQLAVNHIADATPVRPAVVQQPKPEPADGLENPFNSLGSELQQMAVKISSMGFPLGRVARACQALDGNEKKIVEHVLAMTDLLDLGFAEARVASALLKSDNDRDKALDLLIT